MLIKFYPLKQNLSLFLGFPLFFIFSNTHPNQELLSKCTKPTTNIANIRSNS